ncbi:MAG: hypothetical protein A2V86_02855 [Deltaproteobacteria bacterium RBG_16_49_23]|nr:MAG: hypothetical protein A2V86_02855 [Deltaproteobacteria bacterium RBG_16_49_23]
MQKGIKFSGIVLAVILISLISTPAFARSVSLKDAGMALWIFAIIGAVIVLLQLIPAAILFFTFIGTTTGLIATKKAPDKGAAEKRVTLPGYEPTVVER